MFSKKMVLIVGVIILIAFNIIFLAVNSRQSDAVTGFGRIVIAFVAPFQEGITISSGFLKGIWKHYFNLVSTSIVNDQLQKELERHIADGNLHAETQLANRRLRALLGFEKRIARSTIAAEVIGRDPSPWFKTIIVNKGHVHGVAKGSPVVVPEGIVGLVVDATASYAKVLLIIDQNSAVDGLVQKTRAHGVIKGDPLGHCNFKYVLRKHDVSLGDTVVSSGLDGIYPKGLRIGRVSEIIKLSSGIFQEVSVTPYVDFETLEEVLILSIPMKSGDTKRP
jgi:rod shape-determining protein MreC